MVLASDSVAAVCTEWYSCSIGGCRWLQLAAVCTENWLQIAVHGCTWLQCALKM